MHRIFHSDYTPSILALKRCGMDQFLALPTFISIYLQENEQRICVLLSQKRGRIRNELRTKTDMGICRISRHF